MTRQSVLPGRPREAVEFDAPEAGVWPPELLEREQWMGHIDKRPFAPWADRDHPEADDRSAWRTP